jgi:hypothetical protein
MSLEWAEITDPQWTPTFDRSRSGLLTTFTGSCPRCGHSMVHDVPYGVPPSSGVSNRTDAEEFTMMCSCGYPHQGHPDGDNSCGAYWPYEAEL